MTHPSRSSGNGGHARRPGNGTGHPGAPGEAPAPWQRAEEEQRFVGQPLPPGHRGPPPAGRHTPGAPPPPPDWSAPEFNHTVVPEQSGEPPAPEPPPTFRSRKPWVVAALLGVLLTGAATGGYLVFLTGPEAPGPAAANLLDKINEGRFGALERELCVANRAKLLRQLGQLSAGEFDLTLGEISARGDSATVRVTGTYSAGSASYPVDQKLGLRWEEERWKICDLAR
ncbi:hypothetical protein SAMN04487905_112140 [Actinopolyspora xinjiangensis]|uniref:DUF4878 domain-containing protein n=1 Tax=Actinopolyspora xinjiangensis TaxID=405564 RepID=A0A1H0WI90_9ACTN|nr:hypothetical protein [Actinopolyspora xinjiangensis]SDP90460.1 hypothetical protein SAMN04487905_112140 [Actinopolyspora xinjiangensis]